ncbi:hypothetical protein GGS23DRAFT_354331 [Durotheca rogersii]|uniref:uncharacterized protein n=1 Tax=Durotheca rogersii TaxID=419775 RepID=UPI0022206BFC|nr:uncharacterized protein GGS23DRAFT_354331 [Durotheca rogersii]KAI5865773.1 hypothetical protein GGS23DRAFT_354331 [Durotheca rogersii]
MPRRGGATKRSRAAHVAPGPCPVSSGAATPLSSALPSTYASETEYDGYDTESKLSLAALTLGGSIVNPPKPGRKKLKSFRFLDLPSELRLRVYDYHFAGVGEVLDLDPDNYKRIHRKLAILRTCRTVYREASYYFYSTFHVRIFPTNHGRFLKTKKPLLARMLPNQRALITTLQLRLGPGWSKPPRSWVVNPALGLSDCINVTKLAVYVECDPGMDYFEGFRQPDNFFERFSKTLFTDVLAEMPWVGHVEFDARPSVRKSGLLMRGLLEVVTARGLRITWGQERGWTDAEEVEKKPAPSFGAPLFVPQGSPSIMVVV